MIQNALNLSEAVLNQQSVNFVFVNSNQEVLYPATNTAVKLPFTKKQWHQLTIKTPNSSFNKKGTIS